MATDRCQRGPRSGDRLRLSRFSVANSRAAFSDAPVASAMAATEKGPLRLKNPAWSLLAPVLVLRRERAHDAPRLQLPIVVQVWPTAKWQPTALLQLA
jgi:hypothetical protein